MQEAPRDDNYHRIIMKDPLYRTEFCKFVCRILGRDDDVEDVQYLPVEAYQFADKSREGDILLSLKTKKSNLLLLIVEAQSTFSPVMHERMHIYATLTQFRRMERLYAQCVQELRKAKLIQDEEASSYDCLHPKSRRAVDRMYTQLPQIHMVLINTSYNDWRTRCFPKEKSLNPQPIDVMSYEEYRRSFDPGYNTDMVSSLNFDLIIINMVKLAADVSTAKTDPISIHINKKIHQCSAEDLHYLYQYVTYYLATSQEGKVQYLQDIIGLEQKRAEEIAKYDYEQYCQFQDGLAEGEARGEARGRIEGEARGRIEGEARGRIEGEARGRIEGKKEMAAKMKNEGIDLEIIEKITELPRHEILAL